MARLSVRKEALRDLGIRSKNKCAFPGCDHPILNLKGEYVAELCHIEAAEPGGPRFNPAQSDEERRSPENLLLLCHRHHKETDDEIVYTVSRLQEIKTQHEALPEVVFNHGLLLQRMEAVMTEQFKLSDYLRSGKPGLPEPTNYPIVGPFLREAWTPESGRFYESGGAGGTKFKFMMRDGWLHIEQTLIDGAVAYYEINEKGSVRKSHMPYPINEYRVDIPESIVLSREQVLSSFGTHAIRTTLKWSIGTVTEHFQGSIFVGADCNARCVIDHRARTIRILEPKGA